MVRAEFLPLFWCILAAPVAAQRAQPPLSYNALRLGDAPTIDGKLDDAGWSRVPWSVPFVDIEGARKPNPPLTTRMKIAWDSSYLYIGAELEEPNLWATLTRHDAVIYHDNDFEWFIDPDGDGERYFEFEINALGTGWDLFLTKSYRHGGKAINSWDITGLRSAVALDGSLNDPSDRDRGWTVELAVPWQAFADSGRTVVPPRPGDEWRINFSRVEWDLGVTDGQYHKLTDEHGKPRAEHNWVWSPQGEINMHIPERWGVVRFVE